MEVLREKKISEKKAQEALSTFLQNEQDKLLEFSATRPELNDVVGYLQRLQQALAASKS